MVRVISVHNFLKQDISSVDELIDIVTVSPDILLLVQSDHTILIRDMSVINDMGYNIPTVDQVVKIIYSIKGSYIGALEKKTTRNAVYVYYIRIYLNWEKLRNYKEFPPMRARIAGRVTPLSQNHEGLEMIEIPTHDMPDNIACCPISGNLLVTSKNAITIYKLKIQVHDISKIYFIDFEQISVDFLLSFIPVRIELVENMVAAQNDEFLHVFKIVSNSSASGPDSKDKEFSGDDLEYLQTTASQSIKRNEAINYEKLLNDEADIKYTSSSDVRVFTWKKDRKCKIADFDETQCELTKINVSSYPVRHDFPTIAMYRSLGSRSGDVHKQNPFLMAQDLVVNMINTTASEDCKIPFKIENILQYQLIPLILGSSSNREIQEKFTCLTLKPFYSSLDLELHSGRCELLESEHSVKLKTVACFFGTQQEGYLHCFQYETAGKEGTLDNYVVYPFTAPVIDVKLEDSFLHALTDTGLETYTMRAAQHLIKSDGTVSCPSADDPVCLIGFRPFVNVFKMFITYNYLVLFANNEESSDGVWTLYKLTLPSPSAIWNDFLTVAEENKWEAPATYCQLVGEGHLILKIYLNCSKWVSQMDECENHLFSPHIFVNRKERMAAEKLYKESCALLGDFHITNGDFSKASNYYGMCEYKMCDIARRVEALADTMPERLKGSDDETALRRGLIFHLRKTLAAYDEKYSAFTGNREEFYTPEIGSTVNFLLDYLEKEGNLSISDLLLDSLVLREFSTDRILKMMKNVLSRSSPPLEKDALSLSLMCIQRDQVEQAKTVLRTISPQRLEDLLRQHYHLLFEKNNFTNMRSFTELAMVLIETYPVVTGRILSYLVSDRHALNLTTLLKIFLDILPSGTVQSRSSSVVLQIVLESYFKCYFEGSPLRKCDLKSTEALKILIRIYLTILKNSFKPTGDSLGDHVREEILFYSCRPAYLDKLPPFSGDSVQLPPGRQDATGNSPTEKELRSALLKIQSLMSFENIPPECISEVRNYIWNQANAVYGALSLQMLSAESIQEGVQLLINSAPQAVVQYTKDCIKEVDDLNFTIKQVQTKISSVEDDSRKKSYYQQVLTDILFHAAKSLDIEDLVEILPRDLDDGEIYLTLAQNNAQANHIRTLIMTTGKQLQTTLYEAVPPKNLHT